MAKKSEDKHPEAEDDRGRSHDIEDRRKAREEATTQEGESVEPTDINDPVENPKSVG